MCKGETFSLGIGCWLVSLICFGIDRDRNNLKKEKVKKKFFFSSVISISLCDFQEVLAFFFFFNLD